MSEQQIAVILNELKHIKESIEKIEKRGLLSDGEHRDITKMIEQKEDRYYLSFANKLNTEKEFKSVWLSIRTMITIAVAQLFTVIYLLIDIIFK